MKPLKKLLIGTAMAALLSTSALAVSGGATVSVSALNLRAEPSTSAAVNTMAGLDSTVIVLEETGDGWCKVYYNGQIGYMYADYLEPAERLEGRFGTASVQGTSVQLRAEPDTASSVLGVYQTGQALTVLGVSGAWLKVDVDGVTGYMHGDYVSLSGGTAVTGVITGAYVRMRREPNIDSEILGTYDVGTIMTVTDVVGDWYVVSYKGQTGYIRDDFLNISGTNTAAGLAIVDTAMAYLGVGYVYGGTSPSGFDCSGFVYYVYGLHGYSLNRTAASQLSNGAVVEKDSLQPGDLVFFSNGAGGSIGHVGLYVGNGQFIHASSGGGSVIITDLSSDYYTTYYYGARRIVS